MNASGRPAQWTLILGANGTGKTTLLQLLALSAPEGLATGVQVGPRLMVHHNATLTLPGFSGIRRGETLRGSCELEWSQTLHGTEPESDAVEYSYFHDGHGQWSGPESQSQLIVYAYGARRVQGPPGLTADRAVDTTRTLFDEYATLRNPEEWLLTTYFLEGNGHESDAFDLVRKVLVGVLPGIRDIDVNVTNRKARATVDVLSPDGWIPFSELGLGYRTMTAWMVDLASRLFERYPDMKNPLKGAAVCLVDEIDLHLHPRWQRDLIPLLTDLFPQTQFIATAHSPLIVQSAGDANIVVLRREGDHVVIDNSPKSVRNWRLDQILTSELFGVPSARAPELDALQRERDAILGKAELSDLDKKRLAELRSAIGVVPYGDSELDREAMDLVRRVYALHDKP